MTNNLSDTVREKIMDTLLAYHIKEEATLKLRNPKLKPITLREATNQLQSLVTEARIDELERSLARQWAKGLNTTVWKQYQLDRTAELKSLKKKE